MSEIADFLRARYAERRALAEAASPGPWHANAEHDEVLAVDGITVAEGFALSGRQLRATVDHIAANDPDDVLADCDAKLAIVTRHSACGSGSGYCDDGGHGWDDIEGGGCPDLADLAQQFAGHPHHKGEEWAP
jgi:hypothetical protein